MLNYLNVCIFAISLAGAASAVAAPAENIANRTISNNLLHTWWHASGEMNFKTTVGNDNVRQSHVYSVQVSSLGARGAARDYYDSFVYETIPRNGNGKILIPNDPTSMSTDGDMISFEPDLNFTMAWSQFLYASDVSVKIKRLDGRPSSVHNVLIRPTTLNYDISSVNGDIYITVPYNKEGIRFSVEFKDNLFEYHLHDPVAPYQTWFVQDVDPNAPSYVSAYTAKNPIVGIEPHDALLIFASPFPTDDLIPDVHSNTSVVVQPGLVTGLDLTEKETVIFNPGVYYFTGTAHANLSASVNWVHFAPGAYIKGAIQFNSKSTDLKATGHGVLSGEQYVYQANPTANYTGVKSDEDSLRMWSGTSFPGIQQTFTLKGPTINAPPFNTMDFTGDNSTISVRASDYKQVGAFFGQTDGIEMYPGSYVHDIFYHSNDDTIKTYYSDVLCERVTVWRGNTGAPTVEFGWHQYDIENITVANVDIIHSKYLPGGAPSLVGAQPFYEGSGGNNDYADLSMAIKDVIFSNFRSEGISGALFIITPLSNLKNFLLRNFWIEEFPVGVPLESTFNIQTDTAGALASISDFVVENYYVGNQEISFRKHNWGPDALGHLNISSVYLPNVTVT